MKKFEMCKNKYLNQLLSNAIGLRSEKCYYIC